MAQTVDRFLYKRKMNKNYLERNLGKHFFSAWKLKCGTFDYSYDVESNDTAAIFGGFSPKPLIEVIIVRYFHYILRVI
jgi:hypothetical protein